VILSKHHMDSVPPKRTFRNFLRGARPGLELALGLGLAALLREAAIYLPWIRENVSRYLLVSAILVLSYGLYTMRRFCRYGYGFLEAVIGFYVIFGTMERAPPIIDDPSTDLILVQIAAGIYIIIRGFDNMAQSEFMENISVRATWEQAKGIWARIRKKDQPQPPSSD
jgi:hypothetical protein